MSDNIIHVDTSSPLFKAPPGIESYTAWLEAAYHGSAKKSAVGMNYYAGVGQKINSIIYAANHKQAHVITYGPDAQEAAAVITKLSGNTVQPQIIKGNLS